MMPGREGPVNPDNFVKLQSYLVEGTTLDIGAGEVHPHASDPDDATLDSDPDCDPSVIYEVEDELPFEDNEYVNVTAVHFLEHLPGMNDVRIWDEMQRVASRVAVAVVPLGPRPDPDHEHVYRTKGEVLTRFNPTEYTVSRDPVGGSDLVIVETL